MLLRLCRRFGLLRYPTNLRGPPFRAQLSVEDRRVEAVEARSGEQAKFAEHCSPSDVVEIDPKELAPDREALGRSENVGQAGGARDGASLPRNLLPVAGERNSPGVAR